MHIKPLGKRLVKQIITANDPFIFIAVGKHSPKLNRATPIIFIGEQLGLVVLGIINICARLSAWSSMKIEDDVQAILLAPCNEAVD
ncbi:hypothetical protein D3C77_646490 [compost metagenome]